MAIAPVAVRADAASSGTAGVSSAIEARFAALERRLTELAAENGALRQQVADDSASRKQLASRTEADTKVSPPLQAVTYSGKEAKFVLGGVAQVYGETGGVPDARYAGLGDRFLLRRLRVSFAGYFTEGMAFKIESDFGNAAIGNNPNSRGQITDAVLAWTKYPALKLQAGQFKTPFGFDQLVSDPKTLFIERSLANDCLTVGRQIGTMATGDLFGKTINYSLGIFNGNGVNLGNNDNSKFMTSGRLAATVLDTNRGDVPVRWSVGTNFFNTVDRGAFTGRRTGYGLDTQVYAGPAELGVEWLRNDRDPVTGRSVTGGGSYVYGLWNFTKHWQTLLRFDHYDSDADRPDTTTREWTYGVTYFLKGDDLKFTLNYVRGEQPAPAPKAGRLLGRVQIAF